MKKTITLTIVVILTIAAYGQNVHTTTYDTWTTNSWQNSLKQTNTYDGNSYLTNNLSQLWDSPTSSYKNNSQINYINNSNGTAQQYISQTWDINTNTWNNSQRTSCTYNPSNKLLTTTSEMWTSGSWQNSQKQTNTYDVNDYLTNNLTQLWDSPTSSFKNYSQVNYINNSNGTVQQYISQTWDNTSNTWNNSQRVTFTYINTTGIFENDEAKFIVYPNPTNYMLYFNIDEDIISIQVFGIDGKLIMESSDNALNVSQLPNGIYQYKTNSAVGHTKSGKFSKVD